MVSWPTPLWWDTQSCPMSARTPQLSPLLASADVYHSEAFQNDSPYSKTISQMVPTRDATQLFKLEGPMTTQGWTAWKSTKIYTALLSVMMKTENLNVQHLVLYKRWHIPMTEYVLTKVFTCFNAMINAKWNDNIKKIEAQTQVNNEQWEFWELSFARLWFPYRFITYIGKCHSKKRWQQTALLLKATASNV